MYIKCDYCKTSIERLLSEHGNDSFQITIHCSSNKYFLCTENKIIIAQWDHVGSYFDFLYVHCVPSSMFSVTKYGNEKINWQNVLTVCCDYCTFKTIKNPRAITLFLLLYKNITPKQIKSRCYNSVLIIAQNYNIKMN
jgi:hypothetical protein